jgi:hypothetical protein
MLGMAGRSGIQHSAQWAADPGGAAVQDVRVDLRGRHVPVAEELLDGPDVAAILEQVCGERVPQRVRARPLVIPARQTACFAARCKTDSCR